MKNKYPIVDEYIRSTSLESPKQRLKAESIPVKQRVYKQTRVQ